jgi:hypothetical protein
MASEQRCVVCGMGSHRSDWVKTVVIDGVKYVACDKHDQKDVVAAATKAAGLPPAPTPKPVAARVPGSKPFAVPETKSTATPQAPTEAQAPTEQPLQNK